jgi:hypothetical protein
MCRFLVSVLAAGMLVLAVPAFAQTPTPTPTAPTDQNACDLLSGLARLGCETVVRNPANPFSGIMGNIVKGPFTSAIDELTRHLSGWAANRISKLYADVRTNTSPDLTADWFVSFYNKNFFIAVVLLSLVVVAAILWGGVRGSGADIGEAIWGGGIAFALMFIAPTLLKGVLEIVDLVSSGIIAMSGSSGEAILNKFADGLRNVSATGVDPAVNPLIALATAGLAVVGALLLWVTFTIRNWLLLTAVVTGIFVLVLKGTPAKKWVLHLASFQAILALMPIPIAVGLGLAVHALGAIGTPTVGTDEVLGATGGLVLSGLLPWKLFKYMPYLGMAAVGMMHNPRPAGHMAKASTKYTTNKVRSWSSTPAVKGRAAGAVIAGGSSGAAAAAIKNKAQRPPQPKITINVLNYTGPGSPITYYGQPGAKREPLGTGGLALPMKAVVRKDDSKPGGGKQ